MNWIESLGGPLIVLAEQDLPHWLGGDGPDPETDYARACAVEDYFGFIAVGTHHGIVFGDDPMPTAWQPFPTKEGGFFVRWFYGEDEASVLEHLASVPDDVFRATSKTWKVSESRLYLFDSVFPGAEILESVEAAYEPIELNPGEYAIDTADYRPDANTALIIHRLRRIDAQ